MFENCEGVRTPIQGLVEALISSMLSSVAIFIGTLFVQYLPSFLSTDYNTQFAKGGSEAVGMDRDGIRVILDTSQFR